MSRAFTDLDVLAACEAAVTAPRGDLARNAFVTWLLAQHLGWSAARSRVPRSSWFVHIKVLRKAGIKVPAKPEPSSGIRALDDSAGLLKMVGKRFRLTSALDEVTSAGACGTVLQILFRNCEWIVGLQFDGPTCEYEELCIGRFAKIAEWVEHEER